MLAASTEEDSKNREMRVTVRITKSSLYPIEPTELVGSGPGMDGPGRGTREKLRRTTHGLRTTTQWHTTMLRRGAVCSVCTIVHIPCVHGGMAFVVPTSYERARNPGRSDVDSVTHQAAGQDRRRLGLIIIRQRPNLRRAPFDRCRVCSGSPSLCTSYLTLHPA